MQKDMQISPTSSQHPGDTQQLSTMIAATRPVSVRRKAKFPAVHCCSKHENKNHVAYQCIFDVSVNRRCYDQARLILG